ncbi:helix-turn-helix domain-containing protein [Marinovum sp.]|uniref:helix-turn-helix domain-containing protein n=1 Tax=Marinovum sp. TaxID=2024839 RepID=UPI003A91C50C
MTAGDPPDILARTGAGIRRHRTAAQLSLQELARLSGISSSALSLIETGKRDARLSTLDRIARALNTEIAGLVSPSSAPSPKAAHGPGYDLSDLE